MCLKAYEERDEREEREVRKSKSRVLVTFRLVCVSLREVTTNRAFVRSLHLSVLCYPLFLCSQRVLTEFHVLDREMTIEDDVFVWVVNKFKGTVHQNETLPCCCKNMLCRMTISITKCFSNTKKVIAVILPKIYVCVLRKTESRRSLEKHESE